MDPIVCRLYITAVCDSGRICLKIT